MEFEVCLNRTEAMPKIEIPSGITYIDELKVLKNDSFSSVTLLFDCSEFS
jgi:hypothetical protein